MAKNNSLREVDAPFYNYWQALYHSFFSSRLYVDVAKRWKGLGILYFLLLMAVVTLPFSLRATLDFNHFFKESVIQPLTELPEIFIQNGEISVDKPMPVFIKNKAGQIVSIVDTSGKITAIDKNYPYLSTLFTKDKVLYRLLTPQFFFSKEAIKTEYPVYAYSFSGQNDSVFDAKEWVNNSGVMHMKYFMLVIIYPTIFLLFFFIFLVFFLAFALMAQFIAKLFLKVTLSYQQASRLLFVSSTPFMALLWATLAFGSFFYGEGFALSALLAIYFIYGVLALRRETNKLVLS